MVHVIASERVHRRKRAAALLAFVVFPALAAGYYFGYNVGTLAITITDDDISAFASLNITFSEVQVHAAGALTPSSWVTVDLQTRVVDLVRLSGNVTALLGLDKVTAGKYSQVRIVVDAAYGVLKDGRFVDVQVPSGELKTETPFEVKPQGSLSLLLRLAVVENGNMYLLRPAFGGVTEV